VVADQNEMGRPHRHGDGLWGKKQGYSDGVDPANQSLEARYGHLIDRALPGRDRPDVRLARLQLLASAEWSRRVLALPGIHGDVALTLANLVCLVADHFAYSPRDPLVLVAAELAGRIAALTPLVARLGQE
jgi:hypothetical protein